MRWLVVGLVAWTIAMGIVFRFLVSPDASATYWGPECPYARTIPPTAYGLPNSDCLALQASATLPFAVAITVVAYGVLIYGWRRGLLKWALLAVALSWGWTLVVIDHAPIWEWWTMAVVIAGYLAILAITLWQTWYPDERSIQLALAGVFAFVMVAQLAWPPSPVVGLRLDLCASAEFRAAVPDWQCPDPDPSPRPSLCADSFMACMVDGLS